jgi:hypothetical protein
MGGQTLNVTVKYRLLSYLVDREGDEKTYITLQEAR